MIETPNPVEPKKSNTGLMIGIGGIVTVVVLLCCLVLTAVVVIAALTIMGPLVGKVFSTINKDIMLTSVPRYATPDLSGVPTFSSDLVPQGGRGDQILRASAWAYVLGETAIGGCSYNPKASDTTIKITQEPDSDGVWKEEWTVACDDGSKRPYNVTFTPSAGGGTEIKVTSGE